MGKAKAPSTSAWLVKKMVPKSRILVDVLFLPAIDPSPTEQTSKRVEDITYTLAISSGWGGSVPSVLQMATKVLHLCLKIYAVVGVLLPPMELTSPSLGYRTEVMNPCGPLVFLWQWVPFHHIKVVGACLGTKVTSVSICRVMVDVSFALLGPIYLQLRYWTEMRNFRALVFSAWHCVHRGTMRMTPFLTYQSNEWVQWMSGKMIISFSITVVDGFIVN